SQYPDFVRLQTSTTCSDSLSLHDALPISDLGYQRLHSGVQFVGRHGLIDEAMLHGVLRADEATGDQHFESLLGAHIARQRHGGRSEEHTSELQSRENLVCRLLVDKQYSDD